jgi:hypothetical protein
VRLDDRAAAIVDDLDFQGIHIDAYHLMAIARKTGR